MTAKHDFSLLQLKTDMRVVTVLLAVIASAVASSWYEDVCPPEQEHDWTIEKLLRHEDCNKFYKCTFGQPVEQDCPAGLWFCLKNWRCEWPHLVDCEDRNVPVETTTTQEPTVTTTTPQPTTTTTTTTTTPEPTTTTTTTEPTTTTTNLEPSTTTTTTTTPEPTTTAVPGFRPNGCPLDVFEHWLLPHETECNLFYYCVWGERALRRCPSNLHFNRVIQVCDWPGDAGCQSITSP